MQKRLHQAKKKYVATARHHVRRATRIAKKPLFSIPFAIAIVFLLIISIGFTQRTRLTPVLKSNDSNVVTLSYDKKQETIPTTAQTVGELLTRLEIPLNSGDIVEPARDTEIAGDNFRINIYRAVPVTIIDGGHKVFAYSAAATPRSIAKQAGLTVYPEDRLQLAPVSNFLSESSIGERVVIDRAVPVTMNLYGTPTTLRTHAKTVGELLKEKNIRLGKNDSVEPVAATPLTTTSQVFLIRKGTQIQTVGEDIPAPIERIEDDNLSFGATAIRQQGAAGKRLVTYQIDLQNGQEVGRTKIQDVVAQEPVKQIVAQGTHLDISSDKTAIMAAAGLSKSNYVYADYIISRESGWCYTKWQGEYGACKPYHGSPSSSKTGYGLCQATPGTKMSSAGADWATNPVTQLKWCSGYATSKYGGWSGAYSYWVAHHYW